MQYGPAAVIYFTLSYRRVGPGNIVALFFLRPLRLTVTTGKGSLAPLDRLNLLSNFGSYLMASLCLFLFFFILLVPM